VDAFGSAALQLTLSGIKTRQRASYADVGHCGAAKESRLGGVDGEIQVTLASNFVKATACQNGASPTRKDVG
jgi:hypothetical protein